jgi:tetratricopeptide (TPR) repeat protein
VEREDETNDPTPHDQLREMSPEEIQDAFRRYDLVVALGVVLLAFFASAFRCESPDLFQRVRTGELIARQFPAFPKAGDFVFSAPQGAAAVNPAWLFDLATSALHSPGGVALVGVKIAVVVLTVCVLLLVRYRGPTLAWHSFCVLLALVALARRLDVGPQVWGLFLLALALWAWHLATARGRVRFLSLLAPIAVVWANVDVSFVVLPIVATALCLGELLQRRRDDEEAAIEVPRPGAGALLAVLAGVWLAGLASPFGWANLVYAWTWIGSIGPRLATLDGVDEGWSGILSFWTSGANVQWSAFGRHVGAVLSTWPGVAWAALALLAAATVVLNLRPLRLSRALAFLVALALPAVAERWIAPSGILLAYVASLSGQEYFLRRFGAGVRTGFWALIFSQATRMALIILVFLGLMGTLTGRVQDRWPWFGFSVATDEYPEAGVRRLGEMGLRGRAFPIGRAQRIVASLQHAGPQNKTIADVRWPYAGDGWTDYEKARVSLLDPGGSREAAEAWRAIFEKWGVTHVVLDARDEKYMRPVRAAFAGRLDFAPIHADDQCIVYGWLRPESEDYALVQKERIRANVAAFRQKRDPPRPTEASATAPGLFDRVFPFRFVEVPPGMIEGTFYSLGGQWLSEPGASVLAAARLRDAVSSAPSSPPANLRLGIAYLKLIRLELDRLYADQAETAARRPRGLRDASLASLPTPSEPPDPNAPTETSLEKVQAMQASQIFRPATTTLTRHHQAAAAIQSALTAGSDTLGAHQAMADLCELSGFFDLALEHYRAIARLAETPQQRAATEERVLALEREVGRRTSLYRDQLASRMEQFRREADELDVEAARLEAAAQTEEGAKRIESLDRARRLRQRAEQGRALKPEDLPGLNAMLAFEFQLLKLAVEEMDKAAPTSPQAAPFLVDAAQLYLLAGRPDRALDRIQILRDAGSAPPGKYEWLLAQYYITQGRFKDAADSLEAGLTAMRYQRLRSSLGLFEQRLRTGGLIAERVPLVLFEANQLVMDTAAEASFYFDLALVHMELGRADLAVEDFKQSLELEPNPRLFPIIAYYYDAIVGNAGEPLVRGAEWTPDLELVEPAAPQADPTPDAEKAPDAADPTPEVEKTPEAAEAVPSKPEDEP